MKLRYEQLFTISLRPEYYTDDLPHDDFVIEPTNVCKKLMSRYKILFKKTFDGIGLYYECDSAKTDSTALRPITAEEKFTFIIKTNNADFWYYADVQNWESGKVYFLKNPKYNVTGNITVLNGPLVNPVSFYPMKFKYETALDNAQGLLEIRDINNTLIKTISVRAKTTAEPAGITEFYLVDLSGYNDGAYTIQRISTTGNADENIYCTADYYPDVLSVAEITYKGGVAYTGIEPFQKYLLNVSSRSTDWFYDVHIRQKTVPVALASELSLKHIPVPPGVAKTFTVSSGPDNANGFVQFKSSVKLSYSQTPMHLQLKKTGNPVPVIDLLPLPSAVDVQKDAGNNLFTKVIINV